MLAKVRPQDNKIALNTTQKDEKIVSLMKRYKHLWPYNMTYRKIAIIKKGHRIERCVFFE